MIEPKVPTHVRDLDSFIIERFCAIRDERERFSEADQTPEQIKEILDMVASVAIGGSIAVDRNDLEALFKEALALAQVR